MKEFQKDQFMHFPKIENPLTNLNVSSFIRFGYEDCRMNKILSQLHETDGRDVMQLRAVQSWTQKEGCWHFFAYSQRWISSDGPEI
jgi:hypothetical protein